MEIEREREVELGGESNVPTKIDESLGQKGEI